MKQKSVHRLVYKIESKTLKQNKWSLFLPVSKAMKECPDNIISLNDSQCLRFIDEINGSDDITEKVRNIQRKIWGIKKLPRTRENLKLIRGYYDTLYDLQFQKDYICVVMDTQKDYDRANRGFSINYGTVNGQEQVIHYKRFLGTNGGIKNSTIVYVNEQIYDELKHRLDNGRDLSKELVPAKLEAYQALICSGSTPVPFPKGVIVVKDCITHFKEDVILIDDSVDGEPKLTQEQDYEIEHNDSDGYGLMLPSYSKRVNQYLTGAEDRTIAGMNVRYAWTKGMLYTFDFVEFADKVAGSYEIEDVWGEKHDIRDAEVILTESMLKLWDSYSSWNDFFENCEKNHYRFSVTKTTPEELENVRDTNYQFLQSYEFTDDEIRELCQPTIDEIKDVIGLDYRKSIAFLAGFGLNEKNVFSDDIENCIKALMIEPEMINDPFIRPKIYGMIKRRIEMGGRGAIRINANFAMISGDPYALVQSMFGMNVTGILSAGEVYHKYWIDKGSEQIACFRAPMTCHNNIRRMVLNRSDKAAHWYQYMDTVLVFNAFDSACEAMNGADKDGDTNMCTDNPIIVRNTKNSPTIICLQKKAKKVVPTEEDIIKANKLAFNDDIGTVTNRITSMIEVQSGFEKGSPEYKELEYRIMCGQLFQQNTIDRAKGIIAKPMPSNWYSWRDCQVKDDDDEETCKKKRFDERIVAEKKPYFMIYVYPQLKRDKKDYIKTSDSSVVRRFAQFGIHNVNELISYENKTPDMEEFIKHYFRFMPVGINNCIVNRISWVFEKEFSNYLKRYERYIRDVLGKDFDSNILKSGVPYNSYTSKRIVEVYNEHKDKVTKFKRQTTYDKLNKTDVMDSRSRMIQYFKKECFSICSNGRELSDILIDICYKNNNSKQFVWDIVGHFIIQTLLERHGGIISYPQLVSDGEYDFEYCGKKFKMIQTVLENDNDSIG